MDRSIGSDIFSEDAVDDETRAINAQIVARLRSGPDRWSMPPAELRAMRARGEGPLPLAPRSAKAETITIPGPGGPLSLRLLAPPSPTGIYLHFHGGGWTLGGADQQDPRLESIAANTGFACLSVEYRLAPEHPYPAAPNDCEAAALWLVREAKQRFGTERLAIGGESAGAHLAVVTLLRLRDRHGPMPFAGANLVSGCYDLSLTPSVRNWGEEPLVLNTHAIRTFVNNFLPPGSDPTSPDISPLYADLRGMPPALFTIGTRDPLLDDSLFMSTRWAAAENRSDIAVYPGGAHVFVELPSALASRALARIDSFLEAL
jgi:acetyl esterase